MGKILLSTVFILLDQISKLAVLKRLHQNESVPIINNIFHITLVYNSGSAFGILRNQNWILTYISVFAIVLIFFLLVRRPRFSSDLYLYLWQGALLLVLCGATGNLIDRIRLGYVVDFLDFRIWPVFNFADSMITSGVFILLFLLFKKKAIE
ncbi:MAG: signal peptidase II [Candidatus Omnitrophica bacterium]|nr:signal peptidase II [Candidatus Omnitrophota bacterium]MBU4478104.1 signal peptidase II [Candidatus Omnitrophota bacterium]MCG2702927.1 signal peptidase II [Candidatus Omnitrophota bacterium]